MNTSGNQGKGRTVLIPVDGSKYAEKAFHWYKDHVQRPGDKVTFANVAQCDYSFEGVGLGMEITTPKDINADLQKSMEKGEEVCNKFIESAKKDNIDSNKCVVINNRPGQALVEIMNDKKAEMVVMGNRGLGTLRRTFLGSVSDYVVHHSDVPVVVVPPEK